MINLMLAFSHSLWYITYVSNVVVWRVDLRSALFIGLFRIPKNLKFSEIMEAIFI